MVRRKTSGKRRSNEEVEQHHKEKNKTRNSVKLTPRTENQRKYIETIKANTVILCNGPAGSGKTLLSLGTALAFLQDSHEPYERIVLVRPAIEACGERLGFLPGGLDDKMHPYIQPIMDNLRVLIGDEGYISRLFQPTVAMGAPIIEVVPIAHARGRTFNNCIIIVDEAQNTSPSQMKLLLTRIGENCKMIIEGDVSQSDVYKNAKLNGLADAIRRIAKVPSVGIVELQALDIQRSPIIGPILECYKDVEGH